MKNLKWKECPQCSLVAGREVWRRLDEFGTRRQGGVLYPQSWCRRCRGQNSSSGNGKAMALAISPHDSVVHPVVVHFGELKHGVGT